MERGESKLRFRRQTRDAQFKFTSEGRLKFLLIISISSFPNHSNIIRYLSGVAKTALEVGATKICPLLVTPPRLNIHFNTILKTFYAQLFTLWSTCECYCTRAEHMPKIQLTSIALPKTTRFPPMEWWYPVDGLVNRSFKNSQKNQKYFTCSFVFVWLFIVCVCFTKFWLVVKINRPWPCKKEFLRDGQRQSEENFCFIEVNGNCVRLLLNRRIDL
jgi:hypothetical protein